MRRRTFLRGVAGVGVSLPFLDLGRTGVARADLPRRYVQIFTPLGFSPGRWYLPDGADRFALTDFAAPLRAHAADMLLVRGMIGWNGADGHHSGVGAAFTGESEDHGYGPSLDQVVADLLHSGPYRTLHFGFFAPRDSTRPGETHTTFAGSGRPISPQNDPRVIFETLFGGGTAGGAAAIAEAHARRRSVLDLVLADFHEVEAGLSASDRRRLSEHADFLRAIELTLDDLGPACATEEPSAYTVALEESEGARLSRVQIDLLVMALACNLSQVVTLQCCHSVNRLRYRWLESRMPGIGELDHHGWTHTPATDDWSIGLPYFREIEKWYIEEVGYLVDQLKRFGLFDGTLVLWGTNEPRGPHGPDEEGRKDRMYVLLGSLGGHYRTGRVVDVEPTGWIPTERRVDFGPALLLNVAQAFGYAEPTFGDPNYNQAGPTPGLTAGG